MDEGILRKIKKCLALSASSNEHEAAAALRQAQKLMAAYGVTAEALAGAEIGTGNAKSTACTKPAEWEHLLAHVLKSAFGCDCIVHTGWFNKRENRNGALAEFVYIGLRHQAMTAAYAHDVLRRQLIKARTKYLKTWVEEHGWYTPSLRSKIAAGDSFSRAFVLNVGSAIQPLILEPAQQAAVQRKKTELLGGEGVLMKGAKRGRDDDAWGAGAEAGKSASLQRPMGNDSKPLQLT